MTGDTEKRLRDDELLIERTYDAPAALVFRLWEHREHMIRWWGPDGFKATHLDWELTVGRRWSAVMVSDQHGRSGMGGVIREVVPGERLVFSFKWDEDSGEAVDTVVTVTWRESGGQTVQSFHQTPFTSVESRDSHVGGWNEFLDKQKAYSQAHPESMA
jgi:uncharacterized protein YndB with AHSA1/START domain